MPETPGELSSRRFAFFGEKRMLSCYDVAQYFLAKADEDAGDLMSNLKLQKLLCPTAKNGIKS